MSAVPRIVVAAPSSGHGKTAVAVGLLAAARARGIRAAGFKIGPDHVDAAYLGFAAGTPGRNLDPQLVGSGRVGPLLVHGSRGRDLAVVEGTMGLFDGLAGRIDTESTAQIAGLLRAPVVLVVDVASMGQSVAALVHGFRAYDELLWLGGVILNRVNSDRHEHVLREALADLGVAVFGALRRGQLTGGALPARVAGVVPVLHGSVEASRAVRRLGETIAANVDVDRILGLARSAPALAAEAWSPLAAESAALVGPVDVPRALPPRLGEDAMGAAAPISPPVPLSPPVPPSPPAPLTVAMPVSSPVLGGAPLAGPPLPPGTPPAPDMAVPAGMAVPVGVPAPGQGAVPAELVAVRRPLIAVAGTERGDYDYPEIRELLVAVGAELVTVDPLRDGAIPAGAAGLVLGTGLPEGYLDEIAANVPFLRSVAALAATGAPVVAGPAGLALLAREHTGRPMAGVLPTVTRLGEHLVLGYREAVARTGSALFPAGARVSGYKQHYGIATPRAGANAAWLWPGGALEGFVRDNVHASYLTVHWAGIPGTAARFVATAGRVRGDQLSRPVPAESGGPDPANPPGQAAA